MGGRDAAAHAAAALDALVGGPTVPASEGDGGAKDGGSGGGEVAAADRAAAEALQRALVKAGGFAALVQVIAGDWGCASSMMSRTGSGAGTHDSYRHDSWLHGRADTPSIRLIGPPGFQTLRSCPTSVDRARHGHN